MHVAEAADRRPEHVMQLRLALWGGIVLPAPQRWTRIVACFARTAISGQMSNLAQAETETRSVGVWRLTRGSTSRATAVRANPTQPCVRTGSQVAIGEGWTDGGVADGRSSSGHEREHRGPSASTSRPTAPGRDSRRDKAARPALGPTARFGWRLREAEFAPIEIPSRLRLCLERYCRERWP